MGIFLSLPPKTHVRSVLRRRPFFIWERTGDENFAAENAKEAETTSIPIQVTDSGLLAQERYLFKHCFKTTLVSLEISIIQDTLPLSQYALGKAIEFNKTNTHFQLKMKPNLNSSCLVLGSHLSRLQTAGFCSSSLKSWDVMCFLQSLDSQARVRSIISVSGSPIIDYYIASCCLESSVSNLLAASPNAKTGPTNTHYEAMLLGKYDVYSYEFVRSTKNCEGFNAKL